MNSPNTRNISKKKKNPFYNFFYDLVKVTGIVPALIWLRPKIYNPYGTKIPRGRVLILSNHPSFLDPITILSSIVSRRLCFLVTKDLYKNSLMTFILDRVHCIKADKNNFALSAFHAVVERLKEERAVVIFPEGQVNKDEKAVLAFKAGAVLMAHKSDSPIMPVYIAKKKKWYQRQHVVIGKPIFLSDHLGSVPSMEDLDRVNVIVQKEEQKLADYFTSLPICEKLNKE